ncbi:Glycosyltransferase involved in cell wall bisynthesis [Streptosporangium canum]|uniref:Glycosyltransferase involved in cell wall bisynthesis n=2 Tax=Streptosporangium canum TaxID=324952 RepID=A0A1I4AAC7_9ACTN|nr:Glycosyltransferase involved in cell wall bisynthesis [Streptosporangium canum]
MRICLLLPSVDGMRGDVRSVVNLAGELAERHQVEIISVRRHRERPFFPVEPGVTLSWLVDAQPGVRHLLPQGQMRAEVALWRRLRALKADVIISTRPGLSIQVARHAPRDVVRIAREWGRPPVPGPIKRFYPRLDAVATATEKSRQEWDTLLAAGIEVRMIPDALPPGPWPRSRMDNRIVAAGGRLVPAKSYDRLIRAFATIAGRRPDWRLRLYGGGPEDRRLRDLVQDLNLHNHVYFMGTTSDLAGEFAKASIVATTSRTEVLGMTVIEAMASGVPVIGFDGPRGPGEFVTDGRSGVLVPEGGDEIEAYASALLALIDDERRRRELAAGALGAAAAYSAPSVAEQWEKLIAATSR